MTGAVSYLSRMRKCILTSSWWYQCVYQLCYAMGQELGQSFSLISKTGFKIIDKQESLESLFYMALEMKTQKISLVKT